MKRKLLCSCRGNSSVTCNTTLPSLVTKDDQEDGPTPLGEYLIGKRGINDQGTDWYKLYPKKEDSSGYYPYEESTQTGRDKMGLHPGVVSKGCVTVFAPTYNSDPCWQLIRKLLDCGDMSYRNSSYSGFLFVIN